MTALPLLAALVFAAPQDAEAATKDQLAAAMRVSFDEAGDGSFYAWPEAPALGVVSMDDGQKLETASLRGRSAVVIFFLLFISRVGDESGGC